MTKVRHELLLGIDIGTASSKGVLADPDGTVVAVAERPHGLSMPRPGWAEHDADAVWWADVVALCRELVDRVGGDRIAGVCVSGLGPCVLPTDAENRALRPAILYGIDTRATVEIDELHDRFGADAVIARGGSLLSTQATGPKLAWLARNEPDVWARTRRMHMASSLAVARLTGEYVLDHHSASQSDPLYDLDAADWARDWAAEIAPDVELPRLAWPGERVGTVHAAGAAETGLPVGTPVAAGTIDAWSEAFSVGARHPGDLMLMYGSTFFFVLTAEAVRRDAALWATAGVEPGTFSLAGGMATSGSLTGWLRELVGSPSWEELVGEVAATPPGARGLLVLPHFAGERTPIMDPDARGTIAGLTLRHGRADLARAVYEATAYGVRHNITALTRAAGEPPRRLVAVGGGTKSAVWPQIVSDVTGATQVVPEVTVGAAYGDALLAAIAAGIVPASTDWTRVSHEVAPDEALAPVYDELFGLYLDLYERTAPVSHALAHRQREEEKEATHG
ncbi:MAG TPA: FGGY family carbohydrate kinase [Solirubrobacteraceae bacterium]|nr:FGGY family carbohydrate kinase [Solirubrobacteraceae bacterium]